MSAATWNQQTRVRYGMKTAILDGWEGLSGSISAADTAAWPSVQSVLRTARRESLTFHTERRLATRPSRYIFQLLLLQAATSFVVFEGSAN